LGAVGNVGADGAGFFFCGAHFRDGVLRGLGVDIVDDDARTFGGK
jgi:hypothetical protein